MNIKLILFIISIVGAIGLIYSANAYTILVNEWKPPVSLEGCVEQEWRWGWGNCLELAKYEQNKHIIKQNDWLICAETYRDAHGYMYSREWGEYELGVNAYNDFKTLTKICGEIP